MKLLHLSDLHIGRRLNEISLIEDQAYILTQILQLIDSAKPDAVMICGDIYDKSIPSAEAVTLFDDFLCRLSQRDTQVMIISGNHDSPERLAFGNRLIKQSGIHISPVYDGKVEPITLTDDLGQVDFWLLPFVKPTNVRRYYPEAGIESYTDGIRVAIENMHLDTSRRNVLLTHQFVTGASVDPDGSEELSVGGADNVDASVFDGFDYVALGHIHGPQNIGSNRIRYCGTPLKYSLSEQHHHKSVTLVELGAKGELSLELLPLTPKRDLKSIRGTFEELTDKAFCDTINTDDFVFPILTDEEDIPDAMGKLQKVYPNIVQLSYDNTRTRRNQIIESAENVPQKTPLELFTELYDKQNNQPMSDVQRQFMTDLIDRIREGKL